MPKPPTGKWPRVQFTFICKTCGEKITLSIYYGEKAIWNNKDAAKLMRWGDHEGHETMLAYEFYDSRGAGKATEGP